MALNLLPSLCLDRRGGPPGDMTITNGVVRKKTEAEVFQSKWDLNAQTIEDDIKHIEMGDFVCASMSELKRVIKCHRRFVGHCCLVFEVDHGRTRAAFYTSVAGCLASKAHWWWCGRKVDP